MGSLIQRSFAAGEIAVDLYARADQTKYQTGLKTCENFLVMRHGGVTNRPGTQMIEAVKDSSSRSYLIKFVFNADQTYVIEVGNLYFRFYREGAQIVVSGVAAYGGGTAYVPGDLVVSGGVNYYCIAATTGNAPPNLTYWYALTGSIFEVPTPYLAADLSTLKIVQSGDVVTITHPSYQPRELRRTGHTDWVLALITTVPGISAPANVVALAGTVGTLTYSYVVTAIKEDDYEESLPSADDSCACVAPTISFPNLVTWDAVTGAVEYDVYLQKDNNGVFGYVGTAKTNIFYDIGYIPDFSSTPPVDRDLFSSVDDYPSTASYWQQRLMMANTNNDPEKVWTSRSGFFKNFTVSSPLQEDDAVTFSIAGRNVNAVRHLIEVGDMVMLTGGGEWTIQGDQAGVLTPTAINPKQHGYTGASEVIPAIIGNTIIYVQARGAIVRDLRFDIQVDGYTGRDLTVFSAHLFENYQIERMDYAQIPHSIVWLVRNDGTLIGLTYMREQEVWGWHRHTTDGSYEDVCVVPEGEEDAIYVIVKRTVNGATVRYVERFASRRVTNVKIDALFLDSFLSYNGINEDSTTMELTGTAWTYEDLVTITASASTFVAGDVGNAIVFNDEDGNEVFRVVIQAYSSGTSVTGYPNMTVPDAYQAIATADWAMAVDEVAGLDHLEDKSVAVLADGESLGETTVSGGSITLDRPYSVIHVGLPYTAIAETLDMDVAGQQLRDSKKKIQGVSLLVKESRGGYIGPDLDNLSEIKTEVPEDTDDIPEPQTGLVDVTIGSTWEETGRFMIVQSDPLPMTILAAIPNGSIGG